MLLEVLICFGDGIDDVREIEGLEGTSLPSEVFEGGAITLAAGG